MIPVSKFSSRFGERVRLVVIHTSEGARDVYSLAAFLNRDGVQASYHGAVDDHRYEAYVNYTNAAWALRNGNQESDNLCLCAFAEWTRAEWLRHGRMLELTAAWIAERCLARRLPIVRLSDVEVGRAMRNDNHPGGVTDHDGYTKGTGDGTHWDVGENFPFDIVIPRAQQLAGSAPPPQPSISRIVTEDQTMHVTTPAGTGNRKQDWPTRRVSFGLEPGTGVVRLNFGFPGGWVHEAKWWVANQGTNKPHDPVPLNFSTTGGQERFGGMGWVITPPAKADEVELLLSAPGGVHILPGKA